MGTKTPFVFAILMSMILVISLIGCRTSEYEESVPSQETYPIEDVAKLTDALMSYIDDRGMFPSSKETLAEFCLESDMPCRTVDWSKVFFQSEDDKKLILVYSSEGVSI